jgi:hypothetical protein
MAEHLALAVVGLTGLFLLGLGATALLAPAHARRFLLGFAGTPGKHCLELALRVAIGAAFVLAAPRLPMAGGFTGFGWVLIGTSLALAFVPWRWHNAFAQRNVPQALRFLPLLGVVSVGVGLGVLWAVGSG